MQTLLAFFLGLCCLTGGLAQTEFKRVSEENVTLPCQHRLGLVGANLDIEWLSNASDHSQKVILSYSGGQVYENEDLKGRYSFSSNFLAGDAAMFIRSLEPSDAGLYTCKVKNAGQYEWSYIRLKILVKPSEPDCWVEGEQTVGRNITLHCHSLTGSQPMSYRWERIKQMGDIAVALPSTAHLDTAQRLVLKNVSAADNGSYRCVVSNDVGKKTCNINLTVKSPTNVAFLAGTVCGTVGGVFVLFFICWFVLRKKELKKREEDEFLNEIREDAEAPKARLMKPGSSSSGSRSSRSGSSSTRSTTNSASRSQRTLSTQETPRGELRHHCLDQI
ncbi:CXADR-like membrane protein [Rana temporaria]|uniref:CXADR-like membrane protein n=1 Tax=Rana temporaria TaxID=8407 RepID=UPI001AAC4E22|nr:CXADR-like membrane protein [Rana temporaria]